MWYIEQVEGEGTRCRDASWETSTAAHGFWFSFSAPEGFSQKPRHKVSIKKTLDLILSMSMCLTVGCGRAALRPLLSQAPRRKIVLRLLHKRRLHMALSVTSNAGTACSHMIMKMKSAIPQEIRRGRLGSWGREKVRERFACCRGLFPKLDQNRKLGERTIIGLHTGADFCAAIPKEQDTMKCDPRHFTGLVSHQ